MGGPVVVVGIICPPPVGIGLTDLPNIGGGGEGAPRPPDSSITAVICLVHYYEQGALPRILGR